MLLDSSRHHLLQTARLCKKVDELLQLLLLQLQEGAAAAQAASNFGSSLQLSEALARLLLQRVAVVSACRVQSLLGTTNQSLLAATAG